MDSNLDRWVQRVTAAAVLALAAALLVVGFAYYGRGAHLSPAQTTEVR
jgi:GH18 family chitinase